MEFPAIFLLSAALLVSWPLFALRYRRQKARIRTLERSLKREHQIARTDPLTGLLNRAAYEERLTLLTAPPCGGGLCCVMLDVDRFKDINDEKGHPAGDRALQSIAAILRQIFDETPHELFRIGGDEFALILHELTPAQADARLSLVNPLLHRRCPGPGSPLSVSSGRAFLGEPGAPTAKDAFELADQRMYGYKKLTAQV